MPDPIIAFPFGEMQIGDPFTFNTRRIEGLPIQGFVGAVDWNDSGDIARISNESGVEVCWLGKNCRATRVGSTVVARTSEIFFSFTRSNPKTYH